MERQKSTKRYSMSCSMHNWFKDSSLFSVAYTMGMSILRGALYEAFELKFPFSGLPMYRSFLFRKQKDDRQFNTVMEGDSLVISGPPTCHHVFPAGLDNHLMHPDGCSPKASTRNFVNGLKNSSWLICKASFLVSWFLLGISAGPFYFR